MKFDFNQKVTLRSDLLISEPYFKLETAHYRLKDTLCDRYYIVKRFEHFLLSKMDGSQSFSEIFNAFEAHFQRETTREEQENIVSSFYQKGFVKEWADEQFLENLHQVSIREQQAEKIQLSRQRLVLFKPEIIYAKFKWLYGLMTRSWFIFFSIAAFLATIIFTVVNFDDYLLLFKSADFSFNRILFIILLTFVFAFLHELGHGFSTLYFGGNCKEMGLTFRMVIPTPFCRIEPQFLPKSQRIYTYFAGQHVNMLILVFIFVLLQLAPLNQWFYMTFASFYCFAVFMMLLGLRPFGGTDGYLMISDYAGRPHIDQEFRLWLWQKIGGGKKQRPVPYRPEYGWFWLLRILFFLVMGSVAYFVIFRIVLG